MPEIEAIDMPNADDQPRAALYAALLALEAQGDRQNAEAIRMALAQRVAGSRWLTDEMSDCIYG
jgi:hypothetical protein